MRLVRVLFCCGLFTATAYLASGEPDVVALDRSGGTQPVQRSDTSTKIQMTFIRGHQDGPGCLEYSWVSQGLRHHILLKGGQREASENDTIPDDLKPSHVQVYVLKLNPNFGLDNWQFPDGPPKQGTYVVRATVEVKNKQPLEAVGTVYYEDGTTASSRRPLDEKSPECSQNEPR
jgi:hypothetical protein